jgi:AraC-like DNA-binding protein
MRERVAQAADDTICAGEEIAGRRQIPLDDAGRRTGGGELRQHRRRAVRLHLASMPERNGGWLAGLRDESIGRALAGLHAAPERDWSLDVLARSAGMSRPVFAERFAQLVGVPPMQYLAQWRMQLAAGQLSGTSLSLAEVAGRVGYGSEAALSRAFERWVGVSPFGVEAHEAGVSSLSASLPECTPALPRP